MKRPSPGSGLGDVSGLIYFSGISFGSVIRGEGHTRDAPVHGGGW